MKTQKFKRTLSLFLAVLMCVTTLCGMAAFPSSLTLAVIMAVNAAKTALPIAYKSHMPTSFPKILYHFEIVKF